MEKPIELVIEDFKGEIYRVLEHSNLPIMLINMIFNEIHQEINLSNNNNLNMIKEQYYTALQEEERKKRDLEEKEASVEETEEI